MTSRFPFARATLLAMGLLLVGACGDDGDGVTDPQPNPTPTLALSLSPSTLSVMQEDSGAFSVNVVRGGGLAGPVTVTLSGLPDGVTGTGITIGAGQSQGSVTLNAAGGATPGSASVTVSGTAGNVSAQATLSLTVTERPSGTGGFTIALSNAAPRVEIGTSTEVTVAIERTASFDDAISLSIEGLPSGVTGTFSPASATGNQSILTLAASGEAVEGAMEATITATAEGVPSRSLTLRGTVVAADVPSPGTGNATWRTCGTDGAPIWFASQDGDGPWRRIQPSPDGVYRFQIDAARGGVAWVNADDGGGAAHLNVAYHSRAELLTGGEALCDEPTGGKTVHGSAIGLGPLEMVNVSLGGSFATGIGAIGGTFTLENVADGPSDLVAGRVSIAGLGGSMSMAPDRLILRRGIDPADNSTLAPLNFDTEGFAPATGNLTLTGLAGENYLAATTLLVSPTNTMGFFATGFQEGSGPMPYHGMPADRLLPGELHYVNVVATRISGASDELVDGRHVGVAYRAVTDRTLALGPELNLPTISTVSGSYPRPRASLAVQPQYDRYWVFDFQRGSGAEGHVTMQVTSGWAGNVSTIDVTLPDFSGVGGWNDAWAPRSGTEVIWTATGSGWSGDGIVLPDFEDGVVVRSAHRMGRTTP